MRRRTLLLGLGAALAAPGAALAQDGVTLEIVVDVSSQRMYVVHHGAAIADWPVSTARAGKVTPRGVFTPQFLSEHHRSSLYDGAWMPYAIFFNGNYAIHGTDRPDLLGSPASAGCVRLQVDNAAALFELVRAEGLAATRVVVRD